ncbi:MAG: aspartate aminotransferase family protein [Alphaproteobacteria bacterium]|nr:aspartate aminotransferase family protein [Alphaproteobacteria bacterium]
MSDFKDRIEHFLTSSDNLSRRHVHPRLAKMFELGGMSTAFVRGEGQYLWDAGGERYLDLLAGGGVYFLGRNHPRINGALIDVLSMNLPNLCVVNASVMGGMVAEKLLEIGGPQFTKVVFANAGSESTEVALRFARQVTRRRRFLYIEGAFHGRSYGAISVCGFESMRKGIDPAMPTCTPIQRNNLAQLRRELKMGDVAALIFEPVQGMTGEVLDAGYLREAENLCEQHGTLMIADEIQCGLGRTGSWFVTRELGVRPHMMTVSKTLSGGQAPVGAVLVNEDIYERVYSGFGTGLVYFSTFAENNVAMAAALATLETMIEMDAPAEAKWKGEMLMNGLNDIASRYDCIDRVIGKGLMVTIYFKESANPTLLAQQKALSAADSGAFAAAVHVDLFKRQKIVAQIPGPGVNALKVLPPVICTEDDLNYFLGSFEDTIARFYGRQGPIVSLGRGVVESAAKKIGEVVPGAAPTLNRLVGLEDSEEKKTSSDLN